MQRLVPVVFVLMSCATARPVAVVTPQPAAADPIVATFGERVVRLSEAERRGGDDFAKLQDQLYEVRVDAAERIAVETLVEAEAKHAGVDPDEWLETQIEKGLPSPSEGELQELYARAKKSLPEDATYDEVKPQLRKVLMREAKGKRARTLFEDLKRKANYRVVLEPPERPRKLVEAVGPGRGPERAKVVIVEFADFQCPYCSRASDTVKRVVASYPGQVRLVFRHFPLANHPLAPKAAEASACADAQGKFWEYHDHLFANPRELDETALKAHAVTLGLDVKPFVDCLESGRMKATVERDRKAGEAAGINGTPAFFINGIPLSGAQPEDAFRRTIDRELGR